MRTGLIFTVMADSTDSLGARSPRARIAVVSLGGTIASTSDDATMHGVTPQLSGDDLVAAAPVLRDIVDIETIEFRKVPSGDLTLSDMVELARGIEGLVASGVDGVVVTQGTDTMEETSFALDLLVGCSQPVVVTGAMRNPTTLGADGLANLVASVRVAASTHARDLGTLVVFNDEVHAARFIRKTHTSSTATFHSPNCGPLGWIIEDRVRVVARVSRLAPLARTLQGEVPAVALFTMSLGDDARLLARVREVGYAGVVIEGFGGGHVRAASVSVIEQLASSLPVVLASRTGSGELLESTYGFAGSERDVLSRGVLSAGPLDGRKARVLLSLVLATAQLDEVASNFERTVASIWSPAPEGER